ncbi:hypothetical protein STRDD11_01485 [Streptococcus sp. DD11]|nr:hypothetical protein STRDD11_01485 [Streptococcus sp. DD11]
MTECQTPSFFVSNTFILYSIFQKIAPSAGEGAAITGVCPTAISPIPVQLALPSGSFIRNLKAVLWTARCPIA